MPISVPHALRTVVALLAIAVSLSGIPASTPAQAIPIEGYPTYQPQSRCTPSPKAGTVILADHLMKKYPGSGSSGISRSCGASGTSEHKEGRAFDWQLSAASSRDRAYAQDFIERLRATDRSGNANALARRMGIMYVIWNDHIWSASSGYRKRRYLHSACNKLRGCSVTLRHRDHMHISLSWAGARARTSWYDRTPRPAVAKPAPTPAPRPEPAPRPAPEPAPKPKPRPATKPQPKPKPKPAPKVVPAHRAPRTSDGVIDLRRVPMTRLVVPAAGELVETEFKLAKGVTYSLTAAGLYSFGRPDQVADAVCTWSAREQLWTATPRRAVRRTFGPLALVVNGKRVFGDSCNASHTYRTAYTAPRDMTLKVRVLGKHPSTRGRLTLVVGRRKARVAPALPEYPSLTPAPTYSTNPAVGPGLIAETVTLPANRSGATYTRSSLEPGATYRVTVSGVVTLGGGVRSNGQCVSVRGTWYESASIDPRVPGQDHGNLYVDGRPFDGTATAGCEGNVHVADVVADRRSRMRLDLWDPLSVSDNSGELRVLVQRVTPVETFPTPADRERPRPRQDEWRIKRDVFSVDSHVARGKVSKIRLRKGQSAQIIVNGRFTSGGQSADASCVKTASGWLPTIPDLLVADTLNVWVDGQPVRWRPRGGKGGCSGSASYTTRFTAAKNGPLRVSVFDLDHSDNAGELE
ncbi:hypothetical protein, partial [Nocardioides pakistanensis]